MYVEKSASMALMRLSNAFDTAENLAASAAVHGGYIVMRPIKVTAFYFAVTTLVAADNVAPVIEVNRRPTVASSSGEAVIASMTIPEAAAVGKVYYKFVEPVLCYPGDELSFELVTQATDSGTAAGAGFYGVDYELVSEAVSNCGDWVASA